MEVGRSESRDEKSEERCPAGELKEGVFTDSDEYDKEKSRDLTKSQSKDNKKNHKEKDHRSKVRYRSKTDDEIKEREGEVEVSEKDRTSSKEKRRGGKEDHEKDRTKDKVRGKYHERDKHMEREHDKDNNEKYCARKRDRESETQSSRCRDRESRKEKRNEEEKAKDKDKGKVKNREREKEKERTRDRVKEIDYEKNRDRDVYDREQEKYSVRVKEREADHDKDKSRSREKGSRSHREDYVRTKDVEKHSKAKVVTDDYKCRETSKQRKTSIEEDDELIIKPGSYVKETVGASHSQMEVEQRILKMKEKRTGRKSDSTSEILSWVSKSRNIEDNTVSEREKAFRRSKILQEQDILNEDDNEDDIAGKDALAGVKVLHGLDKVLEGGAVVLTLKDQDILANDVDMLENVEIGEQKRRNEAYKATKKSLGVYDDKFNDELGEEKKMLPLYDDPAEEEGLTLAAGGRLTAEAEKKLEALRKRLQGGPVKSQAEDMSSSVKILSDYFTPEEILNFKKPKKNKSLRKKDKLDIDALETEAISAGLGAEDLCSRKDNKSQTVRQEKEQSEAERRLFAYKAAYAKAEEASKTLRMEQDLTVAKKDDDAPMFADDAEYLQKSLKRARKLALNKQNEKATVGPEAIARLVAFSASQPEKAENSTFGDPDNKVVFTEMEEFVWGLQLDEESQKPNHEDVFMVEDDEPGGWTEVADSGISERPRAEDENVVPVESIYEAPVGKGLAGALMMLKERGSLKETIDWGGRNMDKQKSKLVGIHDDEGPKEIHLEKRDEYGRILTPKEAFRLLSHKFHGKGPGKMKLEKRMKQYHDELKLKQMTSSETLPQSVKRMREAQAQLKTPYLVLSGHVRPGKTSDPRSGFATVENSLEV